MFTSASSPAEAKVSVGSLLRPFAFTLFINVVKFQCSQESPGAFQFSVVSSILFNRKY